MAESNSIDQWQDLVKFAMKVMRAKPPFVGPTRLTTVNFCIGAPNSKKINPLNL